MASDSPGWLSRTLGRSQRLWRDNGLSIVLLSLFLALLVGQALTGRQELNAERADRGEPALSLTAYLRTGHFVEATTENWESEFLQMAVYILFTVSLFQLGSSESKKPGAVEAVDRDPREARGKVLERAPWPVRRGGWMLRLYENSLSLAFILLFVVSFTAHAIGGADDYNQERLARGDEPVSVIEYFQTSRFWFESLQNWQSEFLAIGAMVLLSIHLRQRGSPESKPVDAPHSQTGSG